MDKYLPYNGEESDLRDVFGEVFDTNSTKMDFQDVLKNVFNHSSVTDHSLAESIDQVALFSCII
jgi:DNA-directed RNA polymerase delta subunit